MAEGHIGKILGGRYRVDSLIESTELAELCRGTNTTVDREVTIKVVSPRLSDFKNEIFDEARKISRISHPNVLSVTDLGEDADGTVFVVYEAFEGSNLSSAVRSEGQFTVERSIDIVRQAASALIAVTSIRDTHGSLKPENILLGSTGESAKVFNFFGPDTFNRPNRDPVFILGTENANYFAPELIMGMAADERSDVYTLGVLLFSMLTGEIPFASASMREVVGKINNDPPAPMSSFRADLPTDLERVILTAMAKNPEMRYQTIAEFSDELAKFATGSSIVAAATTVASAHDIWKTAFVVLAAVSLLTVALIYATSVKSTDPATQLQADANGQPVQPIGPATGVAEQNLASMQDPSADSMSNSNTALPPGTLPGGDGYDPWKNGGKPPPGAPSGGQVVTIDPNNPSPFMTNDGPCIPQPSGIVLCPAPVNRAAKPTPTPKPSAANANVAPKATPTPEVKPSPAVMKPPAKPAPTPKPGQSGKPRNGDDL
ncbi:MAG: protein kinase [Acidobacteriota bacterium]